MAFDEKVMRRAQLRFEERKQRHSAQQSELRSGIYQAVPELGEIDREIRQTMSKIISRALVEGRDPLPAIRVLRDENMALQRRRQDLLAEHHLAPDCLEEKPLCAKCGDRGYVGGRICSCLLDCYREEQVKELSRMLDLQGQSFDRFDLSWYSDVRAADARMSSLERMEKNRDICYQFAAHFDRHHDNLLLTGKPGLGKTFLSASIARLVSEEGYSVVYDTAGHVFSQMEAVKFGREEYEDSDVGRYEKCDLLIVDDLGTEMMNAFVPSALYQLVNDRLLRGQKTVISTNLSPREIGERYGAQTLSRLEGEYQILPFFGEDIRRLRRKRGQG